MPAPVVASFAKKAGISVPEAETRWKKAKAAAAKAGQADNYAYVTGVFKKMMGEAVSNRIMETTITSMIPTLPHPLEMLGPFGPSDRRRIVSGIKTIFPKAEDTAIEVAVFGDTLRPIVEKKK